MNVYQYIAYSTPDAAYEICKKNGYYDLHSEEDLAYCLQSIVAIKGEPAFKEIMELHPDKEAILELFEKIQIPLPQIPLQMPSTEKDCSCMKNADGSTSSNLGIASQTNLMILAAAVVVSISIIALRK